MATTKTIKTNKFGEINITATSDKYEFCDNLFSARRTFQTRKAWEDTDGHIWVKYHGEFHMLHWAFGGAYLPIDYRKDVCGYEC